jgi:hypothetical protein
MKTIVMWLCQMFKIECPYKEKKGSTPIRVPIYTFKATGEELLGMLDDPSKRPSGLNMALGMVVSKTLVLEVYL